MASDAEHGGYACSLQYLALFQASTVGPETLPADNQCQLNALSITQLHSPSPPLPEEFDQNHCFSL